MGKAKRTTSDGSASHLKENFDVKNLSHKLANRELTLIGKRFSDKQEIFFQTFERKAAV